MTHQRPMLDELRIDRAGGPRGGSWAAVVGIAVVFAAIVAVLAWGFIQPKAAVVRTAAAREVSLGTDRTLLNASGYVTARRAATVSSKVTGKVLEVAVEEGM